MITQKLYDRIMALRQDNSLSGLTQEPLNVSEYGTSGRAILVNTPRYIESVELPELCKEFHVAYFDFERNGLVLSD